MSESLPLNKVDSSIDDLEKRTYAKVTWRLLPILFISYIASYLDRVNVGFAKLQMLNDLHMSEVVYGFGAGVFFFGYFLAEVPSNVLLSRVGARRWIARIMLTWAILSGAMAFVTTPTMFYVVRFLLGVAEAGFFPGVVLYLTYWFPSNRRGKIVALFMTGIPLSGVIGSPLSGWILGSLSGLGGFAGWQWLFIIEAVPSLMLGVLILFYLDDHVQSVSWLSKAEKELLARNIDADAKGKTSHSIQEAISDRRVWLICFIWFTVSMSTYGLYFWLPTIIKASGVKDLLNVGLLSAVPSVLAAIGMVLVARRSDRHVERRWHIALSMFVGAAGLTLNTLLTGNVVLSLAALTLALIGIMSASALFWSIPTAFFGGTAAAAGIAFINSVGSLAGFVSPYLIGWIKSTTDSTDVGLYVIAIGLCLGGILVLTTLPARLVNR